ncbi:MAG: hypothetical protein IJ644_06460 [Oscillospiraceae bacterium]|nr:hypothetical protein [Oscillospiraceae bacterium]
MNIMITCIGILCEDDSEIQYNKGTITARMTSEACCKYLLKKRSHAPDLVIALCAPDTCKENKEKKKRSGYSYFETAIRDFCKQEDMISPDFETVKISKGEESANYFGKSIYKVRKLIHENGSYSDTRIMIDTALKAHPINIMLQMMIRLLKNDGYKMIESYYAYPEKEYIAKDDTSHQLDMIEAISEFSEHGTADKMSACFRQNSRKKPEPVVIHLLEAMQEFSDSIQLCQTERLQDILNNEIFPTLEEIENMTGASSMREDVFTLKLMAEDIRSKFGYSMTEKPFIITPMLLIEWCLKNRYIQQAVTLFVESVPKYLVSSGILKYDNLLTNQLNSPEVNLLYTQVILACCPKEKAPDSVSEASTIMKNRNYRTILMNKYLTSGHVDEKDAPQIQLFIDTLNHFKSMIGSQRPKTAIRSYVPANDTEKLLIENINKADPNTYDKFVNTLKGKQRLLMEFAKQSEEVKPAESESSDIQEETTPEMNEIDKKLCGIRNFSMKALRNYLRGIKLHIHRDKIEQFRRFLAYYVYIKKCVRNYLNHAQEYSDKLTPEQISEFQSYSVHTGALTIKNITENLTEALSCLDNCIIKDYEQIRPLKKYYLPIPKRSRVVSGSATGSKSVHEIDGVILKHYHNPMNSPFFDYDETRFPIVPVIANTVRAGETIKIYGIKPNLECTSIWESALFDELNELLIEKDFDYEYEAIEISDFSDISAPLNLFRMFTETVAEGDKLYIDMSSIEENQIPITLMMFMNYVIQYQKNTMIEAVIYGQFDNTQNFYALYDITKLIYANHEMHHFDGTADVQDVLRAILSYGKQESDETEDSVHENDSDDEIVNETEDSEISNVTESADDTEETIQDESASDDDNDPNTDDTTAVTADDDSTKEISEELKSRVHKKYHCSSLSKFLRSVGKHRPTKQIVFNGKIITKPNKHFG